MAATKRKPASTVQHTETERDKIINPAKKPGRPAGALQSGV